MSEPVHAPHPVKQSNLTRKFPLTDMPTSLMAALGGRGLLITSRFVGSFDEIAILELRAGADQVD